MRDSHLAVEVSLDSVRFVSIKNNVIVNQHDGIITGKDGTEKRASLDETYQSASFLKDDFEEITVSWSTDKSSLIPNAIFSASTPQSIFELCYGKDTSKHEIDYNRISELSVINVYEIPIWIKSFFVIKYPRVIIQHTGSHLVRRVLDENAFKVKATIVLFDTYFQLTIVKHNELIFYSSFDYQSAEDVIYHLNFALQQKEVVNEKGTIELATGIGSNPEIPALIKEGLGKIKELRKMEIRKDADYMAKSQLLCV
ncbi:MAG: DUF3822 family protein [Crocinitomicaceae bacterium]|nr:DUF3822 family protein [Crocinitomicaceae bacterium]